MVHTIKDRVLLSEQIANSIEKASFDILSEEGHRSHLGGSVIGSKCARQIWYGFRWFKKENFSPRILRLFQRGHREEPIILQWLQKAGVEYIDLVEYDLYYNTAIKTFYYLNKEEFESYENKHDLEFCDDPISITLAENQRVFPPSKGERQIRIEDCNGHFGGSLDGIAFKNPWGIKEPFLLEFKTSGTGSKFTKLKENGVKKEKPQHWEQMNVYGYKKDLKYALYICVNKNDDDIHAEFVKLDSKLGSSIIDKANLIINSKSQPDRISNKPSWFECTYCNFKDICHKNDLSKIEKNCRSCVHSKPTENKQWSCSKFGIIPSKFISKGCDNHEKFTN